MDECRSPALPGDQYDPAAANVFRG